jgi:hypothetical protein
MIQEEQLLRKLIVASKSLEEGLSKGTLAVELPVSPTDNAPLERLQVSDAASKFRIVRDSGPAT